MIRSTLAALAALALSGCMLFTPYSRGLNGPNSSGYTISAKTDPDNRRSYIIFANGEAVARRNDAGGITGKLPDGRNVWAVCRSQLAGINSIMLPSWDTLCTVYIDSTEVGTVYPN